MTPFPHPAHRTGRAELPHPALGQDFTPLPTPRRAQAGLSDKTDHIELFYLPPYAPQMNPDEWLNRDLKCELRTRPATGDRDTLNDIALRFMEALASLPQRVMSYFNDQHVAYAIQNA